MPRLPRLSSFWRNIFHKDRVESELDAEVSAFVEQLTDEKIKAGMSPEEARRAALIELGGMDQVKEQVRDVRIGALLDTFLQDVRYGFRMLLKNRGFTGVAVLTLALGIGANTTIFCFVNALLFRPPAVEAPGRLLELWQRNTKGSGLEEYTPLSYPGYVYYRDHNQVFSALLAFDGEMRPVSWSRTTEGGLVQGQLVSGNFFSTLGVRLVLGRAFLPDED